MTGELIFLIVVLGLAGGAIVWGMFFSRDSRIHRRLVATPIDDVAGELAGEAVRLTGRVEILDEPARRSPCSASPARATSATASP